MCMHSFEHLHGMCIACALHVHYVISIYVHGMCMCMAFACFGTPLQQSTCACVMHDLCAFAVTMNVSVSVIVSVIVSVSVSVTVRVV